MKNKLSLLGGSDSKEQKNKLSYGKLLIAMAVATTVFNRSLIPTINPSTISPLLNLFIVGLQGIIDFSVVYFLVMWLADLANRKRGGIDDPRSKKVKKIINVVAVAMFAISILSFLLVVADSSGARTNEVSSVSKQSQQINTIQNKEIAKSEVTPTVPPTIASSNKVAVKATPKPTVPAYVERYRPSVIGSHFEIFDKNGNVYCDLINPIEPRSEVIKLADVIYKCVTEKNMTADEKVFWEQQFASNTNTTTRARLANLMWDYYYNDNFDHATMWAR